MEKIKTLLDVMARLRDPENGCPWDVKQTFATIAPYTVEEAYEVADAVERNDVEALCDELGDLLLQVVFHAQIAKELELFDFDDVTDAITQKMIRRHPHVFSDAEFENEEEQKAHWESLKAAERAEKNSTATTSALDGVANALPALVRAEKIQKRASRAGLDWSGVNPVAEKLQEEMLELEEAMREGQSIHIEEELGDVLFTVCNLARHTRIDPEQALRKATRKFERRFRLAEGESRSDGKELSALPASLVDDYWLRAKVAEKALSEQSDP